MSEELFFNGFSKGTIDFFNGLKRTNNKAWFEGHRDIYEAHVMEPAKAFVRAMGARLRTIFPNIIAAVPSAKEKNTSV